jgi:signal transduction histidine kinase
VEGTGPTPAAVDRAFDRLLLGITVGLGILTLATLSPSVRPWVSNANLDLVLNSLTAVAGAGVAALAWARYRVERDPSAVLESSAFLILGATRLLVIGIVAVGPPDEGGLSLGAPEQWPLYAWTLSRLATAVLLVLAGGRLPDRIRHSSGGALAVAIVPLVVVLFAFPLARALEGSLPAMIGPDGLAWIGGESQGPAGMEPWGVALQVGVAVVYGIGALRYRARFREERRGYAAYLAVGLAIAAFGQVQWALVPGIYRPLVTIDDLLRATFSIVLLLGIEVQFRSDARALRVANARLSRLRLADAERASLQAAARLAREVHDGLSQDLWLVKLKQARLEALPDVPDDIRRAVTDLGETVDRALTAARSIVVDMRSSGAERSLTEALETLLADFEDDTGIPAEVVHEAAVPALDAATMNELVGIVREALTNVRRHADATRVLVEIRGAGEILELRVVDNGRGFDPADLARGGFGLKGMVERAAAVGGAVTVESRPSDGTRVVVRLPLTEHAPTEGPGGATLDAER